MLFSTSVFLLYFLPSLLLVYYLSPQRFRNIILLSSSLFFYAWGESFYVLVMLLSILLNYVFGRLIEAKQTENTRLYIGLGVAANLGLLASFKYANFLVDSINVGLQFVNLPAIMLEPVHLPLGISFFTFQSLSYLIDVYRKEIPCQKNILNLGLYIALFPQLIAGPIVRYKTIMVDIVDRQVTSRLFAEGAERFIQGLAKKMLIANPIGYVVDIIFALPQDQLPTHIAWLGVILYSIQLYFDFSGYSDMAIGLGRMFGFRFLENFNYPYVSRSLTEFWRRWHISLSSWFKDYLYIPLGGSRYSPLRTYLNLFAVFTLCGLWHGAAWTYVIFGVFHGTFMALERMYLLKIFEKFWRPLSYLYFFIVLHVSWAIFRPEDISHTSYYLAQMFSLNFFSSPFEFLDAITTETLVVLAVGALLCFPVYPKFKAVLAERLDSYGSYQHIASITRIITLMILLVLVMSKLASSTYNPFIYFRF